MKKIFLSIFIAGLGIISVSAQKSIDQKVTDLMAKMTLEEKIGQLNQYNDDITATGPVTKDADKAGQVRAGKLGSILNAVGVKNTRNWQDQAMQSRLKIPLLFGQDVIHGFRTTFPIPLGETATWDMSLIEKICKNCRYRSFSLWYSLDFCANGGHWQRPKMGQSNGRSW